MDSECVCMLCMARLLVLSTIRAKRSTPHATRAMTLVRARQRSRGSVVQNGAFGQSVSIFAFWTTISPHDAFSAPLVCAPLSALQCSATRDSVVVRQLDLQPFPCLARRELQRLYAQLQECSATAGILATPEKSATTKRNRVQLVRHALSSLWATKAMMST